MDFRIRNVALLLLAVVLATGLASAQSVGIKVSQVDSNGTVTQTTINASPGGPVAKAPTAGPAGTFKYWDVMGAAAGSATDYTTRPPYLINPPNPQIATGPDDILGVVNRSIVRYPNPNAAGNTGASNPYQYPATENAFIDQWLGTTTLTALCPNHGSNSSCAIDNLSIRYDQMQGRFVVLFTITDLPAHYSNFVLIVSAFAQFQRCGNVTPTPVTCPTSSPLFEPPVVAPIVGGTSTGGVNGTNWFLYKIPINLLYTSQPTNGLGTGIVGTINNVTTGGSTFPFVTANFCPGGGPVLLNGVPTPAPGGTVRTCTNYFPTGARMGLDNDNIILTAAVLDQENNTSCGTFGIISGEGCLPLLPVPGSTLPTTMGPYAGTRVVTVSKLIVYNNGPFIPTQPPACDSDSPIDCTFINLTDNVVTGTLTENGKACSAHQNPTLGTCEATFPIGPRFTDCDFRTCDNPIEAIYWEPDNLRGRALASFDSQVAPAGNPSAGVITPIDYLVGLVIEDGQGDDFFGFGSALDQADGGFLIQPIIFSCPGSAIVFGVSEGLRVCGVPSGGQIADQSALGPLFDVGQKEAVGNASPVGQGFSATQMTSNPANASFFSTDHSRLFVGDSRPLQVMFREGILYTTHTVRSYNLFSQGLGTSTVVYDLLRTCSNAGPNPTCGSYNPVNPFSVSGPVALVMETEWFNGQNVPDPTADLPGFGFYAPMFESPADVVNSGPISPINFFPWLEKLFVGMTTGGTANLAATFSKDYASLWDFRPGDDAYDTAESYVDPYTGIITTSVPCPNDITTRSATLTNGSKTVSPIDTTGLGQGMFVSSSPSSIVPAGTTVASVITASGTITLSNAAVVAGGNTCNSQGDNPGTGSTACVARNVTLTFSLNPPNVNAVATLLSSNSPQIGANQLVVDSLSNINIGATLTGRSISQFTSQNSPTPANCPTFATLGLPGGASPAPECASDGGAANFSFTIANPANIAPGMEICPGTGSCASAPAALATLSVVGSTGAGSPIISLPGTCPGATCTIVFPGDKVTGDGITGSATVLTVNQSLSTVTINQNVAGPSNLAANLVFSTNVIQAGTIVVNVFAIGTQYYIQTSLNITGPLPLGRKLNFSSANPPVTIIPAGLTVINTCTTSASQNCATSGLPNGSNVVSLSGNLNVNQFPACFPVGSSTPTGCIASTCPALAGVQCTGTTIILGNGNGKTGLPVTFTTTAGQVVCPMIPWSHYGGASTDPNDGSLWLYGAFAKNRVSFIPGFGVWGTSMANYALDFPANDPYNNDNSFFVDVQPCTPGSAPSCSGFFTWIQIAKNLGLAVPSATAGPAAGLPCVSNGASNPPIQQPPAPGTLPTSGPNQLLCPSFGPSQTVTRAEMAYWVVRAQMDEVQVGNFLCASGGDPTGLSCAGGPAVGSFGDVVGPPGVVNPFLVGAPNAPTTNQLIRYIEVMSRRGYTKGCGTTLDPISRFCPAGFDSQKFRVVLRPPLLASELEHPRPWLARVRRGRVIASSVAPSVPGGERRSKRHGPRRASFGSFGQPPPQGGSRDGRHLGCSGARAFSRRRARGGPLADVKA
jgi:hypothetical protein